MRPRAALKRTWCARWRMATLAPFLAGALRGAAFLAAGFSAVVLLAAGLRALGFSFQIPNAKVFNVSNTLSTIRREMEIKSILSKNRPDGVLVSDDLTAILTMKIAQQLELDIPNDLKVIGYDGTTFVEKYFSQLTTIKQPIHDISSLIVDVLLKKIKGEKTSKDYILPISLLPGDSI